MTMAATAAGSTPPSQLPVLLSLVHNIGDLGAPPVEGRAGFAAEHRIPVIAVDRSVEERAPSGKSARRLLDKVFHQQQKLLQRACAIVKSAPAWLTDRLPRVVEGRRSEILLCSQNDGKDRPFRDRWPPSVQTWKYRSSRAD